MALQPALWVRPEPFVVPGPKTPVPRDSPLWQLWTFPFRHFQGIHQGFPGAVILDGHRSASHALRGPTAISVSSPSLFLAYVWHGTCAEGSPLSNPKNISVTRT